MKWFQHQSAASSDRKLKKLLIKYGAEGYGLYWYCIENICSRLEHNNLTFEIEHDSEILAHELKIDTMKVEEMMLYMVNVGLFEESNGDITCLTLARYLGDNLTRDINLKAIIREAKAIPSQTVSDSLRLSVREERTGEERTGDKDKKIMSSSVKSDPVPFAKIIDLYHQKLPQLPAIQKMTKARQGVIKQRWKSGDLPALENWENFFDYISQSDFLMGRAAASNGRPPFVANLEWVTKESNYTKILEGKYHGV